MTKLLNFLKRKYSKTALSSDEIPVDFDAAFYLEQNPDVASAELDPAIHYLQFGRYEGRVYARPKMQFCSEFAFDRKHETILVVSHEASRTGAPILTLNIVQALEERYNVVVLLLGGGALLDAFQKTDAAVLIAPNLKGNPVLAEPIVESLCERFNFKFALVNSIESRVVLPALSNHFVPAISLLHEFASYTRPRDAFRNAFFWSSEVIFSASMTMENAFDEYPDLRNSGDWSAHVHPQGRCLLPLGDLNWEQIQAERARVLQKILPNGSLDHSMVVLGAGYVHFRKGVDLFIECAARVVRTLEGCNVRFVWVGNGYDPDNDILYSVYLADQIRRAGLQGHVFFVDETPAIEAAYEVADLLLLTSRLDPLPNVAIDAMAHGVPVLCFDKTTGIADFLIENGLRDQCVAEYLDTADMAKKVLALAGSQLLRTSVADLCLKASKAHFNMDKYVASLEVLAQLACECMAKEKADTQTILDSGLFRKDFSAHLLDNDQSIEKLVRSYVRAWASGVDRRKPFPGFHPGIYLEQHGLAPDGGDPFADYLRAGQPEGPWNYPVIVVRGISNDTLDGDHRVALHLHIYYLEPLNEIMARLSCNKICPDLFISISHEEDRKSILSELRDYKGRVVDIQLVPKIGRDIWPFFTTFGPIILANYDFVGHIHTKKSIDITDALNGELWRLFLLENLLGSESRSMADSILASMKTDSTIGLVFPDDPHVLNWGANRAFAEPLAARMMLEKLPNHSIFPMGTMFWARTYALIPLINLKLDWDDHPEEPLPFDGTLLHAIERLLPLTLSLSKLRSATTNVIGLTW